MAPGRSELRITPRSQRILQVVWSLGWASRQTIEVVVPMALNSASQGLQRLHRAQLVRPARVAGDRGMATTLWRLSERATAPGGPFTTCWCPPLRHVQHTLFVAAVLRHAVRSRLATEWRGEGELRLWPVAGEPVPDLRLLVLERWWSVEVDTATYGRHHWLRKLEAYHRLGDIPVLVVTTAPDRAERLARLAADREVALVACGSTSFFGAAPEVYDARYRKIWALSDALTG